MKKVSWSWLILNWSSLVLSVYPKCEISYSFVLCSIFVKKINNKQHCCTVLLVNSGQISRLNMFTVSSCLGRVIQNLSICFSCSWKWSQQDLQTRTKVMHFSRHFWACVHVWWWLCLQSSALCLDSDVLVSRDVSEWGVGVFPPANDSTQVRLRVDKAQWPDTVQSGENGGCRRHGEEKEIRY